MPERKYHSIASSGSVSIELVCAFLSHFKAAKVLLSQQILHKAAWLNLYYIMQQLFEWDQHFFFAINNGTVNSFFDWLMPIMRNSKTWLPLYILILVFACYKFRLKGIWWFLFAGCAVILCNYISSDLIKENIWRIRPCRDPLLAGQVRVFPGLYCPSSSSFTSSHAANHFGMAAYMFFSAGKQLRRWLWLFFLWAFIIIYAQVYVGVHYPGDVLAGSLVGLLTGGFVARIFNKRFGLLTFDNLPT